MMARRKKRHALPRPDESILGNKLFEAWWRRNYQTYKKSTVCQEHQIALDAWETAEVLRQQEVRELKRMVRWERHRRAQYQDRLRSHSRARYGRGHVWNCTSFGQTEVCDCPMALFRAIRRIVKLCREMQELEGLTPQLQAYIEDIIDAADYAAPRKPWELSQWLSRQQREDLKEGRLPPPEPLTEEEQEALDGAEDLLEHPNPEGDIDVES